MISPINEHTVPWPADVAKRYVADGYWAGIAIGTELWTVVERAPAAPALHTTPAQARKSPAARWGGR